jgi:aconitate hydratase
MYLGVRAILAKSFARIHRDNLLNYAVLPLRFVHEEDYEQLAAAHQLEIRDLRERLLDGATAIPVHNLSTGAVIETSLEISPRQRQILLAGGLLRYVGKESNK